MHKENQQESPNSFSRDDRLDLVKAISISLVLVWHLRPIKISIGETPHTYIKIANFILDQMYLNLTLIAVPLFILTSLILLFQKLQTSSYSYVLKRCRRLLEVFIFWLTFQFFIYYSVLLIQSIVLSTPFSWTPNFEIPELLTGTQPKIPFIGDSVFYFLLVVIELTIISYILFSWKANKFKNYVNVAIIIISLVYFEASNLLGESIPYWRLDNFLIYIPIAYFFVRQREKVARKHIVALYIFFLIFGLQDIFLRGMHYEIGIYSRISVICGALAVFCSCLNLRYWKASESVKFLSGFSLGIFAIHKYWKLIITVIVPSLFQILGLPTEISIISTSAIFVALASISLTFGSVLLLNRTPLQKFIR